MKGNLVDSYYEGLKDPSEDDKDDKASSKDEESSSEFKHHNHPYDYVYNKALFLKTDQSHMGHQDDSEKKK